MYMAIDQGMANLGLTVYNEDYELLYKAYITTGAYDTKRLLRIKSELECIIKEFNIKVLLVEDLMIHNDKNFNYVKKAIKATAVIEVLCQELDIQFLELPLRAIKSHNGKGNLNKNESMQISGETNDHISDSILIFNYFRDTFLDNKTDIQKYF